MSPDLSRSVPSLGLRASLRAPASPSPALLQARSFLAEAALRETLWDGQRDSNAEPTGWILRGTSESSSNPLPPHENVARRLLDALLCVLAEGDEITLAFVLTSSIVRDLPDNMRAVLVREITTAAHAEGIVWSPLLSRLALCPTSDRHNRTVRAVSPLWSGEDVAVWLEQARQWLQNTPSSEVLHTFRLTGLDFGPWLPLLARTLRPMTSTVFHLIARDPRVDFQSTAADLLARTDLTPDDWRAILSTSLGLIEPLAGQATLANVRLTPELESFVHRTIAVCGGLPDDVRAACHLPSPHHMDPSSTGVITDMRPRLLAWDPATPIGEIDTWLTAGSTYSTRLGGARLLMTHPTAAAAYAQEIKALLTDPKGSGYHQTTFRDESTAEGKLAPSRLASSSLRSSQKIQPAVMQVITSQIINSLGDRGAAADVELVSRALQHPSATDETWTQIAIGCDYPSIRTELAAHPLAKRVPAVRAVLLRQRRPEVLVSLMADASEIEFFLLWNKLATASPHRAVELLEQNALPFPVPRAGFAPILKSGHRDLILRATGLMSKLVETPEGFGSITRAVALAETLDSYHLKAEVRPELGQALPASAPVRPRGQRR